MPLYNLTAIGNQTTGLFSLISAVNTNLMGGWLGVLLLLVVSSISFMAFLFSTNDTGKSLGATMFITFGFSILLRAAQLIPDLAFFMVVIGFAASVAIMHKTQ